MVSSALAVIAEGHPFCRHGLAKLVTASGMVVVGEAPNGWAAVKAAERTNPRRLPPTTSDERMDDGA